MIDTGALRKGLTIEIDGNLYSIIDWEHNKTGRGGAEALGDDRLLLADNLEVQIHKYNGEPIGVQFPPHVELTVASTEPGVRGDTAQGGTKQARLETGFTVNVPLFLNTGDKVKVDTRSGEYLERA